MLLSAVSVVAWEISFLRKFTHSKMFIFEINAISLVRIQYLSLLILMCEINDTSFQAFGSIYFSRIDKISSAEIFVAACSPVAH